MVKLLSDMFHRGHPADVTWFLIGIWLMVLFVGFLISQVLRKIRRGGTKKDDGPGDE